MRPIRLPSPAGLAVLVASIVIAGLVWAPGAPAHSTLIRACPGTGDVLGDVEVLELEFGTPLLADGDVRIDLIRADDETVAPAVGPPVFSDDQRTVTVDVVDELTPGNYILRYQVTSADGDLNDGGHAFTVDPDATPESDGCDLDGGGGGSGGLILLGVGVVAVGALAWFLRPRRNASGAER